MRYVRAALSRRPTASLLGAVLLVAAVITAVIVVRATGSSRAMTSDPGAGGGTRSGGKVRHLAGGKRVALPYRTITLDPRATPRGDATLRRAMSRLPLTRLVRLHYTAHDGRRREALLLLPRAAAQGLPLVIAPHGRGGDAAHACSVWGDLPGYARVAVVCADDPGRNTLRYSWGDPGTVRDLARLPRIVARAMPGLVKPRAIYAVGDSMGGQEVLLLVAARPRLLRGAVAMDPTTDLTTRYTQLGLARNGPNDWQPLMRLEVGGTPAQLPHAYALRSPVNHVRAIAASGVPLEVWWSSRDRAVPTKPGTQAEGFIKAMAKARPREIFCERMGWWPHGWPWRHSLWAALRFLGLMQSNPPGQHAPGRLSVVAPEPGEGSIASCHV